MSPFAFAVKVSDIINAKNKYAKSKSHSSIDKAGFFICHTDKTEF
jgi:hypothetical protein